MHRYSIMALDANHIEEICQDIIAEFDKEVPKYFTEEDLEKGYLKHICLVYLQYSRNYIHCSIW